MVTLPQRELKIGQIVDKTLGVLEHSATAALIYLVGLAALNVAATWYTQDTTVVSRQAAIALGRFVVGVVAAYFLLEAMVQKSGLRARSESDTFLPYLGLSIVSTLGVMLGFILLIIPGLLLMARWMIAQPLVVARGEGVMRALGESWERTRGNEFPILIAVLALFIAPIAIVIAAGALFAQDDLIGMIVSQAGQTAMTVLSLAMAVAVYGLLVSGADAARTFE